MRALFDEHRVLEAPRHSEFFIPAIKRINNQNITPLRFVMFRLFNGSLGGTRTPDQMINSHLLYRLSYQRIGLKDEAIKN